MNKTNKYFIIQVPTQELSEKVQKFLFEQGFRWKSSGNKIIKEPNFLYGKGATIRCVEECGENIICHEDIHYYQKENSNVKVFNAETQFEKFVEYITNTKKNKNMNNVYYKPSSQSDAIAAMYVFIEYTGLKVVNNSSPITHLNQYPFHNSQWIGVNKSINIVDTWSCRPRYLYCGDAIYIDTNLTDLVAALNGEYLVEPPAPKIHGYKGKIIDLEKVNVGYDLTGTIEFGCAKISLVTLQDIYKWMSVPAINSNRSIASITLDSGKILTRQNISDILDYVNKYWEFTNKKNSNGSK